MSNSKSDRLGIRSAAADKTKSAVFSAVCAHAKDPEACQAYVERLEEASLNIERTENPSR